MIDPITISLIAALLGTGGLGMGYVALRKSGPEIRNTEALTKSIEVKTLLETLDSLDARLKDSEVARKQLEARVAELERSKSKDEMQIRSQSEQIRQLKRRVDVLEQELRKLGVNPDDLFDSKENRLGF